MMDAKGIRVALFIILHRFTIMEKQNAILMALMRDNTNFINTYFGKLHEQRIAFKRKETYDSCVFGRVG